MFRRKLRTLNLQLFAVLGLLIMIWCEQQSRADFPIIGFDTLMISSVPGTGIPGTPRIAGRDLYGAMGYFVRYDPNSPDPDFPDELPGGPMQGVLTNNGFDFFEIHAQIVSNFGTEFEASAFGGVGGRFYEGSGVGIPPEPTGLGHDNYGTSFDPADYWLDVSYKLGPQNQASRFDIALDQHDGFVDGNPAGTQSRGEQFSFHFTDIVNRYNSGTPDADGFVTLRRDITELPNPVGPDPNVPWDARIPANISPFDGDGEMDFDAFEGGVRNGVRRIHLKSVSVAGFENQEILNVFIKSVKLVPKTPTPEVARLDGNTGFTTGFIDAGGQNIVNRSAGGNLLLDFVGSSGAQVNQVVTDFDATQYGVEVKAKLLSGSDSASFRVVAKDLDGNDTSPGQGAEEWALSFNTSLFNQTSFTTVFIPWTAALAPTPAFGFTNAGDGLLTDFNLFQFQVANNGAGTALKIEVESIKIIPIPDPGLDGDFDEDGDVDGLDFLLWQRGGSPTPLSQADLALWEANYGTGPLVASSVAVPEPTALCLMVFASIGAICFRRPLKSMA
jgi:hypothetical protein